MKQDCPNSIKLEEFWLTNRGPDDLRSHISSCQLCNEKIRQWEEERKSFNKKYPFERFFNEVSSSDGLLSRLWHIITKPIPVWQPSLAFATLAVLILVLVLPRHDPDLILPKGGPELGYYVSHNGETIQGKSRMKLSPGDELMFYYSSDEPGYLLLIGVEQNGFMSVYYPFGGNESQSILKGEKIFFGHSIRWVPHSSYERFMAIFSKKPVSVDEIGKYIASVSNIEKIKKLPLDYPQTSFIIYNNEN